ncbi:long-chain-fatty-acid--CoA ligase [Corynebacterium kutscheri]|uniref:Acyl-CoA synthetase (AMP-forming)/AMP-acid ligase II n=1 Tax=Corynebacterium kutscheri TaxID=35755 RepID=A0A0F6R140_9CORY|nr:long-chain fatty-acid--CoA ligase [Corynebacterium kutscheri]AKE41650.1 acyl-CoA synthetase (AMP-forming)/AMP-acid ligase II [Corynebacterium kutscheri]VEH08926.1 long-chain-fatty-acid--CoA ligase [Corynebacterium kutscheri]VEH09977.1 long-chain-fatty-acid--CoA ligase [Corynebacterium kutscheri]VEH80056.1 long-chain-fatty-acid--CoA ligase [Corynebacterium kutscheri]
MLSTMQELPLNLSRILQYGSQVHGNSIITTAYGNNLQETSYREVGARASALAHALYDELGITGDQRVGSFMHNTVEHLETLFAVMCMGAVFNPLNRQLMNDQIQHIINHAEDEIIIADPLLADQLSFILSLGCPTVRAVIFIGSPNLTELSQKLPDNIKTYSYEALLDGRPTIFDWPILPENAAAAICYSTGTTGAPKGVAYSQRSLYLQSLSLQTTNSMAITHGETFLCCVPIYHVLSWGVPIAAFMSGTSMVLPGADLSPAALARIIAETHPRVSHGVPSLWIQLFVYYMRNTPERMSLQEIFVGGSAAPSILIRMWEERYGVDVIQVWGMTETSTVGTVARPPQGVSGEAREAYRISQGRFPASLEYRVVNNGEIQSATDRNQGEIQVRGNWVTAHYYQSPTEQNNGIASTFRGEKIDAINNSSDQFTSDGWLHTGDVGSVTSDGFLTIHDRERDVIRSGGEWIYSALLENEIMAATNVVECAVIGYPDKQWGERPLAVTVLTQDVEPGRATAEALRARLHDSFPKWMLPEYWTFVSHIDKTSVGKFDKINLRQHLAQGDYDVIVLQGPGRDQTR